MTSFALEKAELAAFYGWTPREIEALKMSDFTVYLKASKIINAENLLQSITVSSFPQMKKQKRDEVIKALRRVRFLFSEVKQKSFSEVVSNIARRMMSNGR